MKTDDDIIGVQVSGGICCPQSGRHEPNELDGKQNHARFNYDEHDIPKFKLFFASDAQRSQGFVKCGITPDHNEDLECD